MGIDRLNEQMDQKGETDPSGRQPGETAVSGAILIADDDLYIRRSLAEKLRGEGYRVCAVSDGDAARWQLRQRVFDIAMIDYHLPGEPVAELMEEAREAVLPAHVVLMTGDCDPRTQRQARLLSPAFLFMKPMPYEDVRAVAGRIMELRRKHPWGP